MTWLRSADAISLLEHLFPPRSFDSTPQQPRKLRLYLCGLCRAAWRELPAVSRATTELAEMMADQRHIEPGIYQRTFEIAEALTRAENSPIELARWEAEVHKLWPIPHGPKTWPVHEATRLAWLAFFPLWTDLPPFKWIRPSDHRAELLRDIYGNPFRPLFIHHEFRTTEVMSLAHGMYKKRDFSAMPLLGDALEEAGWNDPAVLEHCRQTDEPHTRGCWVLDQVLGLV